MEGLPAEGGVEILGDRLALLERELDWARRHRDRARIAELALRIAELRSGRDRLLRAIA